jgi:LacI family transcriptional regulator
MQHLVSTNRKRIAFIAPHNSGLLESGVRYEAYSQQLKDSGLEETILGVPSITPVGLQEWFGERFLDEPFPDAILCMNDDLAISTSLALSRLGLKVGSDVALVGFDGISETEQCPCPLTTVKQPIEEMSSLAFEFLRKQMEDPSAPVQQQVLKPTLVIRESSSA